jgi:uncharacterized delta-60 repeat protein
MVKHPSKSNFTVQIKTLMKKITLTLIILVSLRSLLFSQQPGDPDSTFNSDGIVTTDINNSSDVANAIAIQPDGKIVVGGSTIHLSLYTCALARYNANGSPDNNFGTNGIVVTVLGFNNLQVNALAIQPDGKIIAAGSAAVSPSQYFALVRYNTDGTLDSSFSEDGVLLTNIDTSANKKVTSLILLPDGKMIAVGYIGLLPNYDFMLVKYLADGSIDGSFGNNGIVLTAVNPGSNFATSAVLQNDGKIVVGGYTSLDFNNDFTLARYNGDGSLDNSFGASGIVLTDLGTTDDVAYSIAIQDGKIVAAGRSGYYFAVVRYTTAGILDTTFGEGGKVFTNIGPGINWAYSVAIQSSGKIVAAGVRVNHQGDYVFAVARYTKNGRLDKKTFGENGNVHTDIGPASDIALAVAIQSDDKIVVAGAAGVTEGTDFGLVRYVSNAASLCEAPSGPDAGNITGSSATLSWNAVPDAVAYKVRYKVAGTDEWTILQSNDNVENISGLLPDTKYVWQVRTLCTTNPNTLSGWSEKQFFTTNPLKLSGQVPGLTTGSQFLIYPNPVSSWAAITFDLNEDSEISIELFSADGKKIMTIAEEKFSKGEHVKIFDATKLPSGIYFVRIKTNGFTITEKVSVE